MEDSEIKKGIENWDEEVLTHIIKINYDRIFSYCYRHTGSRELAQDLTQDTFVKMLTNIRKYTHYGKMENYLYVVAGNVCKDYFKKKKPVYMDELPEEESRDDEMVKKLAVRIAVAELPFNERNAILLHYYHNCTVKEVAKITNSTIAATKYRLKRGAEKLRIELKEVWKDE